ncbi:MAG TPA: 2-oxoglutarate and iron-dependent oxygenase domain-containing protein [Trebonia sp.]|nr:2-oxoglutarate and iron-dependent oxygenase domain-containing protein [Trebonia sp.]
MAISHPVPDIAAWRSGSGTQRDALARRLHDARRRSGFLLIEGHGIDPGLSASIGAEAARIFALHRGRVPARAHRRRPVGGA